MVDRLHRVRGQRGGKNAMRLLLHDGLDHPHSGSIPKPAERAACCRNYADLSHPATTLQSEAACL